MAASHASIALLALLFLGASLTMLFFVILSGVTPSSPLSRTYFLRADTSRIIGAHHPITQWTFFHTCGLDNTDCGPARPALPFGDAWDPNPAGAPPELVGGFGNGTTSHYYWYMWRFGWVFFIMTLFFEVCAFLVGFLACCGRLGSGISGLAASVALFFLTIAVSLMTATFVKARDVFNFYSMPASVGTYAFGFAWGAWAALLIATVLFCVGVRSSSKRHSMTSSRRRSTRSHRSYEMGGAGRRGVKDEYA